MTIEQRLSTLRVDAPPALTTATLLGTGHVDGYAVFPSPVGEVVVSFNPRGVSSVDLADDGSEERFAARYGRPMTEARPPSAWASRIPQAIEAGTPGELPLDLRTATPFRRTVLEAAASIPRGQVRSYGWLARRVGNGGAVRAVGSTMANNPVPLIVPCHRVVRTDGRIGQYSLGGPDNKRVLLAHEGTDPDWLEGLAARGVRLTGSDTTGIVCHPTCVSARRIGDAHRVEFRSMDEALGAGYRACRRCNP